jgi:hypothetical protein
VSTSFRVGDDALVKYPVTDGTGGVVDWPTPTVLANDITLSAVWLGDPAPTRDIAIPLSTLPVGVYTMWLNVPGDSDLRLGTVHIVAPALVTVPEQGGCLWPLDPACLADTWDSLDEAVRQRAHHLASATLHDLTGGRVGGCPVTVRPVPHRGACFVPTYGGAPYTPGMDTAGRWANNCGYPAKSACEIALPAPIGRLDEVKIDGVVQTLTNFRIDNGRYLVWQGGGECPFPAEQDLDLADTEPGTFSVTYLNAYPVDAMGAIAAGRLAAEFGKACSGAKCALPAGVTTVIRQGVTMEVRPGSFPDGFTGIREVDAYIALWNPRGLRQGSTVWSPSMPSFRTTVG